MHHIFWIQVVIRIHGEDHLVAASHAISYQVGLHDLTLKMFDPQAEEGVSVSSGRTGSRTQGAETGEHELRGLGEGRGLPGLSQ